MTRLMTLKNVALILSSALLAAAQQNIDTQCPGYNATNVSNIRNGFKADLVLAGNACNVYGTDIPKLSLTVTYETDNRIHMKIIDPANSRYEVPESVFPRPSSWGGTRTSPNIKFNYVKAPFSFTITRSTTNETLFNTTGFPLVFEPQYLRVKTSLPARANIYGLGEHTNSFRLPPGNTTRTMWNRDAYGVANETNLYGDHPIYFEHRTTGTRGVFLLNSNGMDVKLRGDDNGGSLEYNVIGGILDFYFLAGPSPIELSKQYAKLVGLPAEIPYWGLGLHQCRYGYQNYLEVAQVVANYSAANIPLETMWTDIDYMYERLVFTNDPNYFPMARMREIVSDLHARGQQYIVMVDPAVGVKPGVSTAYDRGQALGIWMKNPNGTNFEGLVWPGVTVWPDWFNPKTQAYWTNEFALFFNPETGLNVDGIWIDMNEPASFCEYPCANPSAEASSQNLPPSRTSPPPDKTASLPIGTTIPSLTASLLKRGSNYTDVLNPPYAIGNVLPHLSDRTAFTNVVHANGLIEYDTHNLYGTMMSTATREALLTRRPGKRPFVITRSTFAGAGAKVGKWLGDNLSTWDHYRNSIAGMLGFASIYQVPEVGSDSCGFGGNTTETLCARWATLGAFNPFYRNHNGDTSISQEFYRWPTVAQAARNAIDMRYRLLDYFYTALHQAHVDGTPVLQPLWYQYPTDSNTFGIDLQFLFGESVLVSPVTQENVTDVSIYLPNDYFYDFKSYTFINGTGSTTQLTNVAYTDIPVYIRGGAVLPLRVSSAYTTKQLRQKDFELVVAPSKSGQASGTLYIDDGESLEQSSTYTAQYTYKDRKLTVKSQGNYNVGSLKYRNVRILGLSGRPNNISLNGQNVASNMVQYNDTSKSVSVNVTQPLKNTFTLKWS
ncbi:related to alpha-glucosidase b [Serendipita indica DSM 11827]|uniref:Probable alpha/beta-glucosidase agdC n=1 Tax=Serendipita indica (strain DSM 11827) TaxID=1109443 RepID=G4TQU4_SERID|nr:related to alpha-glucosidase b [Serendipita indica DSM 11827]